jgi:hypothetical protein
MDEGEDRGGLATTRFVNRAGFKSGPDQRLTTSDLFLVVYEVGFAGARNQHYLQLWRPAA